MAESELPSNGWRTIGGIIALLALIGGVGAIILPIQGSVTRVNDRLDREIEVIERQLGDLDKQLQTEDGTLRVLIDAADDLSLERHNSQGDSFQDQLAALLGELRAQGALIRQEAQTDVAALRERIDAVKDFLGIENQGPAEP